MPSRTLRRHHALRQNEGGFTIGGPVVLPKIYNGRNKTFFFGSLGLFYSRVGASGAPMTVPTPDECNGDFSWARSEYLRSESGQPIPDAIRRLSTAQFEL